jgi:hypothetical protein
MIYHSHDPAESCLHPISLRCIFKIIILSSPVPSLSDERMGLSFTIAADPRQNRHSWVQVPRESRPYFTISDSRLPQPRRPGPCIYIPQEHGVPVINPDTGFPFRRLQLARLQWRYSNPLHPLPGLGMDRIENTVPLLQCNCCHGNIFVCGAIT